MLLLVESSGGFFSGNVLLGKEVKDGKYGYLTTKGKGANEKWWYVAQAGVKYMVITLHAGFMGDPFLKA